MKSLVIDRNFAQRRNPARKWALTLAEMMVTMGVFSLVVMGLLYEHILGLKQDQLVESKLGASDMARRDFEQLATDVRGSQLHLIGNYSGGTFSGCGTNVPQQGNAIQLYLNATNATNIIYYFDTNSTPGTNLLCRFHTGDAASTVVASYLTNFYGGPLLFLGENYDGTTNYNPVSYKSVIHFTLGFIQYQYPLTRIGSGSNYLYDFYKIEFRLAPHVPSGR